MMMTIDLDLNPNQQMDQQRIQAQTLGSVAKPIPVMHSEPNALYEEICYRLEHYNAQIEKLEAELKRLTLMRNVLAVAQNSFDKQVPTEEASY